MKDQALDGCRTEPLGSYLQGLGAWRALVRTVDPDARARWEAGRLVVTTEAEPVADLLGAYEPLAIVSPWNEGSGFAGNGKSVAAERALQAVRESDDPRFTRLKAAVHVGDEIVREGRSRGWGSAKDGLWDKKAKSDVLTLCRNLLPDDAVLWLDVAAVLGQDGDPAYNRLLGTGGNFGRLDLSSSYLQALAGLLDRKREHQSRDWLRAALFGDESIPYVRDAVGQFDPGRAGGIQSSPLEKGDDKGFLNPWSLLLTLEGTLLFASAVVRRFGANTRRAAVPFVVRATSAAFGSAADGEKAMAEMWTPEWDRPATLPEVEHLLSEGRAEWGGSSVRSGLDFVRAVGALGVDRGVTSFSRHVFVERLGQSPLAVAVGRYQVPSRPGRIGMLRELDPWLARLQGTRSNAVQSGVRRVEQAVFRVGSAPGHEAFRQLIVEVGRLHRLVSRSGGTRAHVRPLVLSRAREWWDALEPSTLELRLAGAYASASGSRGGETRRGAEGGMLRTVLTPVKPIPSRGGERFDWANRPPRVASGSGVVDALASAHRLRSLPGAVKDPSGSNTAPQAAVKGVFTAFTKGLHVDVEDIVRMARGEVDDGLLEDYLHGLMLLDWSGVDRPRESRRAGHESMLVAPPVLLLLLPFFDPWPLRVYRGRNESAEATLVLRPAAEWLPWLIADRVQEVAEDAARRLRIAGFGHTVLPAGGQALDGTRVAAALLLRAPTSRRVRMLRRVTAIDEDRSQDQLDQDQGVSA